MQFLLDVTQYSKSIFVFGANETRRHGRGSALEAARKYGAVYGQGYGLQGDSFGIPTKDKNLKILPLSKISQYVNMFLDFANQNPSYKFNVVKVGCGLAGYKDSDIAPMFRNKPNNVYLDKEWQIYL